MVKGRLYKKEYARELLNVAKGDLEAARILSDSTISRKETIFFQAQQAIEKSLKAFLCHLGKEVPLSHDLAVVYDRLPDTQGLPREEEIVELNEFATIRRYEEGRYEFSQEEIATVITLATTVVNWVESRLETKP